MFLILHLSILNMFKKKIDISCMLWFCGDFWIVASMSVCFMLHNLYSSNITNLGKNIIYIISIFIVAFPNSLGIVM